jgi:hypothetical protein
MSYSAGGETVAAPSHPQPLRVVAGLVRRREGIEDLEFERLRPVLIPILLEGPVAMPPEAAPRCRLRMAGRSTLVPISTFPLTVFRT